MDSPYDPIKPTVFYLKGHNGDVKWGFISIRIKPGLLASDALKTIESTFKKVIPSAPFEYKFVDEEYAMKFAAEERIGKLAYFLWIAGNLYQLPRPIRACIIRSGTTHKGNRDQKSFGRYCNKSMANVV